MPSGILYLSLDESITNLRGVCFVVLVSCFIEIHVLNANSVDPDLSPHSVASDLGLHCLPMSLLWDARHKWVEKKGKMKFKLKQSVSTLNHNCSR